MSTGYTDEAVIVLHGEGQVCAQGESGSNFAVYGTHNSFASANGVCVPVKWGETASVTIDDHFERSEPVNPIAEHPYVTGNIALVLLFAFFAFVTWTKGDWFGKNKKFHNELAKVFIYIAGIFAAAFTLNAIYVFLSVTFG